MLSAFSPGQLATLACALEVTAPKPGNVHRGADFEDATFLDFVSSAIGLGHTIDRHIHCPLGKLILESTLQSRRMAATNTNLGMILLISPLAKAFQAAGEALDPASLQQVLESCDQHDCQLVYEAIRLANPGGLGESHQMDVHSQPPDDLVLAMRHAADRDMIARQYANGFAEVFQWMAPALLRSRQMVNTWSEAIVLTHVRFLAEFPDSLIARKCGLETATRASQMAARAIESLDQSEANMPDGPFWRQVSDLDFWLRCDGHRRNPGATADMIAAGLFVGLATGKIVPPF